MPCRSCLPATGCAPSRPASLDQRCDRDKPAVGPPLAPGHSAPAPHGSVRDTFAVGDIGKPALRRCRAVAVGVAASVAAGADLERLECWTVAVLAAGKEAGGKPPVRPDATQVPAQLPCDMGLRAPARRARSASLSNFTEPFPVFATAESLRTQKVAHRRLLSRLHRPQYRKISA
jgi:hypothetical protein